MVYRYAKPRLHRAAFAKLFLTYMNTGWVHIEYVVTKVFFFVSLSSNAVSLWHVFHEFPAVLGLQNEELSLGEGSARRSVWLLVQVHHHPLPVDVVDLQATLSV